MRVLFHSVQIAHSIHQLHAESRGGKDSEWLDVARVAEQVIKELPLAINHTETRNRCTINSMHIRFISATEVLIMIDQEASVSASVSSLYIYSMHILYAFTLLYSCRL